MGELPEYVGIYITWRHERKPFGGREGKRCTTKLWKKKSGLLTMLIHENAREVKQILPENSIRMYLRITITLQNHMSTEKFYQYLH